MYHILFIHSFVNGNLDCFHVLTIVSSAFMNITLGVGDGQGGLACCDPWGRKESDTTERLI